MFLLLLKMFPLQKKHAVWCQCASVLTSTLALSSIMSVQNITWKQDIYWSVVLVATAFLETTVAEHGFNPQILTKLSSLWSGMVYMLIVTGNGGTFHYVGSIIGAVVGAVVPQHSYLILCLGLVRRPTFFCCLLVSKLAAEYQYKEKMKMAVGKTTDSILVKQALAAKTVGILSQTLLLWHLRCCDRFPHIYRWTPLLCGVLAMGCGIYWCHCYIAPTSVSHKSVIKSVGHGLTPSLLAAKKCPVCSSCLTHLDIEDVFE